MKDFFKKYGKWIIGLGILALSVWLVYYLFFSDSSTSKYISADALKKIKSGRYGKYEDNIPADAYNRFWGAVAAMFGKEPGEYVGKNSGNYESLSRGWLKGAGIAMSAENLNEFATDIRAYVNHADAQPHWKIKTAGEFI